ncbi:uncharacterized protein LOC111866492 isoform X3 [Cryptotermes secundus]|uniref:uncharacterized protein LOC111866492 isoform X3 n=1 Tax=Cryptotermes secundus TaxID=105785 RepID=UPI000CD7B492|nr:uncharacterized protein LOC111866492 isoform X3 [Cryptotermes secundus]
MEWCPSETVGLRGHCYSQNAAVNLSWKEATAACKETGGALAGFPLGRFRYNLPNFEDGQFWVGVIDDGIPRPSCKKSAQRGEELSPECLNIDKGCPQMIISSSRDVVVLRSPCDVQVGYICHRGPMTVVPDFCQVQGLLITFLSTLVLCYLVLISTERFVQYTRPEEHDLTFSWLNTYVIQTGVIFLLITDATGPLYGNGQYIFSSESGLCILDPGSRYVKGYISVSLTLYYLVPLLATVFSHVLILLQKHSCHEEDEYPFPSRVIPTGRRGQVLLFFSCVLPFLGRLPSVLAVIICSSKLSSSEPSKLELDADNIEHMCREGKLDFFLVWIEIFSISCILPLLLLTGSSNLRKHVRAYFDKKVTQCINMWVQSRDALESPIELCVPGNPSPANIRRIRNRPPEDEIIEVV